MDYSSYPGFLRGVWASRLDEMRYYLANVREIREAGVDTVMLGPDVVLDPDTEEPYTPGLDVFLFYLQAFKREGLRVILVPNPMHPNLCLGEGYAWEGDDPSARYRPSPEFVRKFSGIVLRWAGIAEEYGTYGFAPVNEPIKLARDVEAASAWLQEILDPIRMLYGGRIVALDTMIAIDGRTEPYPYDYAGFDLVLGGPPCGFRDAEAWGTMMEGYVNAGIGCASVSEAEGFSLYEWGGYRGGVWFEPIQEEQILDEEQAKRIVEITAATAGGEIVGSFPRTSLGWLDLGSPAFAELSEWYLSIGKPIEDPGEDPWTMDELLAVEEALSGCEEVYRSMFMIKGPHPWPH